MLHDFIDRNRAEIIRRCHSKVALRRMPQSTDVVIDHGVPVFVDQLIDTLRLGVPLTAEIGRSAVRHGHDLLRRGFTVSQVVHHYGDVCQAITELAVERHATISTEDFGTLNRCLDDAIAGAVTEYGRAQDEATLDRATAQSGERLGFFAHELRNMVSTAIMAFEVLRKGDVGVGGSTGTVLHRSLLGLRALIVRSLAEVRLTQGVQNPEPFQVAGFIDELATAAALDASERGITLRVDPIDENVAIEADRQVLAAVVGNLLQNACKFTRPHTTVTVRVVASAERVHIEVEDECGGLPTRNVDELFRPFERGGADRTGIGLGLAFSRWGAEANHGRISARDLPQRGCIFAIDLPRLAVPAAAAAAAV